MQPDPLLSALNDIADGFKKAEIDITSASEADVESLLQHEDWSNGKGWVARQSGVDRHPARTVYNGAVIEAEIGTDTTSLQIRRMDGAWITTKITEGLGTPVLFEEVRLVTTLKTPSEKPLVAVYRRYWSLPDCGAAEVIACRLVGFKEIAE